MIHVIDQVLLPQIVIDVFAPDFCSKADADTGCYRKTGDTSRAITILNDEEEFFFERSGEKIISISGSRIPLTLDQEVTSQREVFFRGKGFEVPLTVSPERANRCIRSVDYK